MEFRTVAAYIAAQPASSRPTLRRVGAAIRHAVPRAQEGIDYDMPAYRFPEGGAVYFAGWTKHWAMYPVTPALVQAFGAALAPYDVEKSAIRFSLSKPVPVGIVKRIAKFAMREGARQAAAADLRWS